MAPIRNPQPLTTTIPDHSTIAAAATTANAAGHRPSFGSAPPRRGSIIHAVSTRLVLDLLARLVQLTQNTDRSRKAAAPMVGWPVAAASG